MHGVACHCCQGDDQQCYVSIVHDVAVMAVARMSSKTMLAKSCCSAPPPVAACQHLLATALCVVLAYINLPIYTIKGQMPVSQSVYARNSKTATFKL
jgi:hypothetical protein